MRNFDTSIATQLRLCLLIDEETYPSSRLWRWFLRKPVDCCDEYAWGTIIICLHLEIVLFYSVERNNNSI